MLRRLDRPSMRNLRKGVLRAELSTYVLCHLWRRILMGAACASDCTVCDDGQSGTGQCLGTRTSPVKGQLSSFCELGNCTDADHRLQMLAWHMLYFGPHAMHMRSGLED